MRTDNITRTKDDINNRADNLGTLYGSIVPVIGVIGNTQKAVYKNNAQLGLALAVYLRRNPEFNKLNPEAQRAVAVAMIARLACQGRLYAADGTGIGIVSAGAKYPIVPKSNLANIIRNGMNNGQFKQFNANQVKLLSQADGITPTSTSNLAAKPVENTPPTPNRGFRI
jgi:hypothetical protein